MEVTFLGCTERICLFPYTQTIELPVYRMVAPEMNAAEAKVGDKIDQGTWEVSSFSQENIAKQISEGTFLYGCFF